jgi:sulfite oxidase
MELPNPLKINADTPNGIGYSENGPFAEERRGWAGYIEWERYPDKKAMAAKILAKHHFPPVPNLLA